MARYVKPLIAQHRGATSKFGDRSLDERVEIGEREAEAELHEVGEQAGGDAPR